MALIKCPRCELNYIQEEEGYCKICRREMKGDQPREEVEMCTICNEAPALPGKDVCLFCLKEMGGQSEDADETEEPVDESALEIDPVSNMEEIIPEIEPVPGEMPYNDGDMSLEELEEEEDEDEDEDKDQNE